MPETFSIILTNLGLAEVADSIANGTPITLNQFSVGDSSGAYYEPDASQIALVNETYRANMNTVFRDLNDTNEVVITGIIPPAIGGFTIREVGFWSSTGSLFAIGKFPATLKTILADGATNDFYIRGILAVSNVANVTIVADTSIVMATQGFVNNLIENHQNSNLIKNGRFDYWPEGASLAPESWTFIGSSVSSISRSAINVRSNIYSVLINNADNSDTFLQSLSGYLNYRSRSVTLSAYVKTSIIEHARLIIDDGITISESPFHTSSGVYERLTLTKVVDSVATKLEFGIRLESSGDIYIDEAMLVEGSLSPLFVPHIQDFVPRGRLGLDADGADSSGLLDIGIDIVGDLLHVSGNNIQSITSRGLGSEIVLVSDGTLSIVHDGDYLVSPTGSNIDLIANQAIILREYAIGKWHVIGGNHPFEHDHADSNSGNGILDPIQLKLKKGADVVSASALALGADGNYFDITNTNSITSINTIGVGTVVRLHFDASLTLTHDATDLVLPRGVNIITEAGDEAEFVEYATGDWRCTNYFRTHSTIFGAWVARSDNTVYLAAEDGLVLANESTASNIRAFSDSSNPPTTVRTKNDGDSGSSGDTGITMPVRKGDYWKVTGAAAGNVYWLPFEMVA